MGDVVPIDESVVALLEGTLAGKETPAAALAVARSDGPVSLHAAGLARWEPRPAAAAADTVYLLASVTKPFTATAVLQLAEGGACCSTIRWPTTSRSSAPPGRRR